MKVLKKFFRWLTLREMFENQKLIINLLTKIMTKIEELNAKVDELQATVDSVQEKVATRIAADGAIIKELQDKIDAGAGATTEELQGILDKVSAANDDLKATDTEA